MAESSARSSLITDGKGKTIDVDTLSTSSEESSSYSDDACSSSPRSVFKFKEENGRTYHGYRAGTYNFPNDSLECDRLELQHDLFKLVFSGKSHLAPLPSDLPLQVLDIGTGTGQWAIEMGDQYPNFTIQGTDLSPIQPTAVPPNVEFFVDDASEPDWGVEEASFDYIHTRAMLGSFTSFQTVIERAFHYTKPGGYMESQEFMFTPSCDDESMPADWPFKEWSNLSDEAATLAGRPLRIAHKLARWYERAGFVDVREEVFKMPLNGWSSDSKLKRIGNMSEENWLCGLSGFTMGPFSRMLGWSKEQIEVYLIKVRECISDTNVNVYHKIYVVWGRKPLDDETPPTTARTSSS